MTGVYTVPDDPADPDAAALELIVRFPETILHTDAFRPVPQDYAGALGRRGRVLRAVVVGRQEHRGCGGV
jgi:hypothetical protein